MRDDKENDIEILSPVATWDMMLAAVHNGAQAIYMGMPGYNARGKSTDFDFDSLCKFIEYCHLYGVKVFIAFNILIFEDELKNVIPAIYKLVELSPDAIIVQDIGLARLIKQICPKQVIHGSTQMTVSCGEAIDITSDLEIDRYILARELSVSDISKIARITKKELEVFVHGALCVSYSGQCLTSESFGGRSANRGQCAQSCRFEYSLIVDGKKKFLKTKQYLVSPKDLCAIDNMEELIKAGVKHFKIEGRYKSPEYVAYTTKLYNDSVESLISHRHPNISQDARDNLAIVSDLFNRCRVNKNDDGDRFVGVKAEDDNVVVYFP